MAIQIAACSADEKAVVYPPLHLQEEFRINNPSEAGATANIVGAAVDRDSSIYVMDAAVNQLLVFDSSGHFQHSIGGRGEDPGQFLLLGSTGIIGDTVWVSDPRQGRITLFTRAGKLIKTIDNSEPLSLGGDGRYSLLGILADGSRLIGTASTGAVKAGPQPDRSIPFLRVTPKGKIDTLFHLPVPGTFGVSTGPNTRFVLRPYDERPIIGVRHDGGAWVEVERAAGESGPAAASVTKYSLEHGKEWNAQVSLNAVKIPGSVADSIVKATPLADSVRSSFRTWLNIPKRMPLVTAAMLSTDNTVWLREASRSDSARWIRLDEKGNATGQLILPQNVLFLFAGRSRIWMLRKEGTVSSIVKYRIW